jgi:hypothetical protein
MWDGLLRPDETGGRRLQQVCPCRTRGGIEDIERGTRAARLGTRSHQPDTKSTWPNGRHDRPERRSRFRVRAHELAIPASCLLSGITRTKPIQVWRWVFGPRSKALRCEQTGSRTESIHFRRFAGRQIPRQTVTTCGPPTRCGWHGHDSTSCRIRAQVTVMCPMPAV